MERNDFSSLDRKQSPFVFHPGPPVLKFMHGLGPARISRSGGRLLFCVPSNLNKFARHFVASEQIFQANANHPIIIIMAWAGLLRTKAN